MNMLKSPFGIVFLALSLSIGAQTLGKSPPRTPVKPSADLVTVTEASTVFGKVRSTVLKVVLGKSEKPTIRRDAKPATRSEIVRDMFKLFTVIKPEFRVTPRKVVAFAPLTLKIGTPERTELETLIKWGFIDPAGPLATSSANSMSLESYGDAVGFFIVRVSDLTHNPMSKFSPAIMP